ncbi:MAG: hypothetical protein ACM31H_00975 [Nitrososphaerales archaeon]
MNKIYYKITDNKMESIFSYVGEGYPGVKYKLNKYVTGNKLLLDLGYGLSVFSSLDYVKMFYESFLSTDDIRLFECKIGKIFTNKVLYLPERSISNIIAAHSIFIANNFYFSEFFEKWPEGTVLTNKIKLIKEFIL